MLVNHYRISTAQTYDRESVSSLRSEVMLAGYVKVVDNSYKIEVKAYNQRQPHYVTL